jgi:hypothetical protein
MAYPQISSNRSDEVERYGWANYDSFRVVLLLMLQFYAKHHEVLLAFPATAAAVPLGRPARRGQMEQPAEFQNKPRSGRPPRRRRERAPQRMCLAGKKGA